MKHRELERGVDERGKHEKRLTARIYKVDEKANRNEQKIEIGMKGGETLQGKKGNK